MQNPVALDSEYREHVRRMAWVNANDWQFVRPAKRHPVRQAVAKALLAIATVLTPLAEGETRTA